MPLTRFLDPRFRLVAALIDDPEETPEIAEIVANESGFTFDEALAAAGIDLGAQSTLENAGHVLEPAEADGADAPNEAGGQIAQALRSDPNRSDRAVARACGASPTTVGKLRSALGLSKTVRTVTRRGKSYDMRTAERS